LGFAAVGQLTLIGRLTALRFRSVQHGTLDFHQAPPRGAFTLVPIHALVTSVWGSLRQGPQRTYLLSRFTSCSAPMPGAPICPRASGAC